MIPNTILLPSLSAKDRAEFDSLAADHAAAMDRLHAFSHEARVARKRELRAKLNAASSSQLLSIGAELEMLDASFEQARRGAKMQLKALGKRYASLFHRLLVRCHAQANELAAKANAEWVRYFASFGSKPVGESPVTAFLANWKKALVEKRIYVDSIAQLGITPNPPSSILPYSSK